MNKPYKRPAGLCGKHTKLVIGWMACCALLSGCMSSPSKVPQIEATRGQYGIPFRGEVLAIDLLSALPPTESRYGTTLGELAVRMLNNKRSENSVWTDVVRLGGTALAIDLEQYMGSLNCVYTLQTNDIEVSDSVAGRTLQSVFGFDTFVEAEADTFIYNDNRSTVRPRDQHKPREGASPGRKSGNPNGTTKKDGKRGSDAALEAEGAAPESENKPSKVARGRFISVMQNCVAGISIGDAVGIVHLGDRMALFPTGGKNGIASLGARVLAVPSGTANPAQHRQTDDPQGLVRSAPAKGKPIRH
jgi:hypothetical protein